MKYREIRVYAEKDRLEELVERLTAAGRGSLVINDPAEMEGFLAAREAHVWDYVAPEVIDGMMGRPYAAFYTAPEECDDAAMEIAREFGYSAAVVDDEDWLHRWEEYFLPARITDRFVVKPAWRDYEASEGEEVIEIDPGLAFGTGTHATTFLALRLMEKHLRPGDEVLDIGSGSGILSVGAVKLGAARVWAADLFEEAVESTRKNARLNGCEGSISAVRADLTEGLECRADAVVANLMADLVKSLSREVSRCMKSRAVYISSGIPEEKEEEVSAAISAAGFEIEEVLRADGWCAVAARLI